MDRPFPPGPKGPEDHGVPGPEVTLTRKQAQSVAELAARCSGVKVEDRGATYKRVTMFGVEGEEIGSRLIFPDGSYGTEVLPG